MASSNRSGKTRKSEIGKDVIKLQKMKHPEVKHKVPQVVTPSRPRVEKNMLASFGIKPAQRKQFYSTRDTKLKCCVIETPIDNSIIFRFEPSNKKLVIGLRNYFLMT